jgi:cytochrome c oxidase subunit 3/cytochrome o ubiquinol oxidase subunit 3
VGLIFLSIVLCSSMAGFPIESETRRIRFLSWYWHFVDVVWVIVFLVVYVIGK